MKKALLYGTLGLTLTALMGIRSQKMELKNFSQTELPSKIKIMSVNLARGEGKNFSFPSSFHTKGEGLNSIEKLVNERNIDIACFQEIEKTVTGQHQTQQIARNTNLHNYLFGPNFRHKFFSIYDFSDGNAILSKYKMHDSVRASLDTYKENIGFVTLTSPVVGKKGILHVRLKYQEYPVNVICVHLSDFDTQLGENEKDKEFKALFEYAAKYTPSIVIGDLNTDSQDERWKIVKEIVDREGLDFQYDSRLNLFNSKKSVFPGTYIGDVPEGMLGKDKERCYNREVLDYIIIINHRDDKLKLNLSSTFVENDKFYSDHNPIWATIKIEQK